MGTPARPARQCRHMGDQTKGTVHKLARHQLHQAAKNTQNTCTNVTSAPERSSIFKTQLDSGATKCMAEFMRAQLSHHASTGMTTPCFSILINAREDTYICSDVSTWGASVGCPPPPPWAWSIPPNWFMRTTDASAKNEHLLGRAEWQRTRARHGSVRSPSQQTLAQSQKMQRQRQCNQSISVCVCCHLSPLLLVTRMLSFSTTRRFVATQLATFRSFAKAVCRLSLVRRLGSPHNRRKVEDSPLRSVLGSVRCAGVA